MISLKIRDILCEYNWRNPWRNFWMNPWELLEEFQDKILVQTLDEKVILGGIIGEIPVENLKDFERNTWNNFS